MRTKVILYCLCFMSQILLAQGSGKISGKVLDDQNEAVFGASVLVLNTTLGAAVDQNGYYFIINIPPGTYSLKVSAVGYSAQVIQNVIVNGGLTTKLDISLAKTSVMLSEVIVQYQRPAVQKDLTSKQQEINIDDIKNMPIAGTVTDLLTKQAGITKDISTVPVSSQPVFGQFATIPNDGLHFRGGRTNETLYLLDGIAVNDALWGGFNLDVFGEYSLQSMRTLTGTFGPQYGEAMSGVIEMETLDNTVKTYSLQGSASTDNFGGKSGSQNTKSFELASSGPVAGLKSLSYFVDVRSYSSDGYINGYIYPGYVDSRGTDFSSTPKEVPMAFRDNQTLLAKLIYEPVENVKIRVGFYGSDVVNGVYSHYFKYNPYGTPNQYLKDKLVYAKFTHVLSPSTYYDVTVSKYVRKFDSHVYDNAADYAVIPQLGTAEFSIAGEDYVYFRSAYEKLEGEASFSSQITKQQFIKAGASYAQMRTAMLRMNPDGFEAIEDYDLKPRKFSAYVNDKMEFDDIGMVINVGLRFDRIDPNRTFILDMERPDGTIGKVKARQYFSPRFGISYPISESAAFRFGYGYYYQYPSLYEAFQGMNRQYALYPAPNINSVSGAIGKGDIKEEKTINYECGVQFKVSEDMSADVTAFYRKSYDLIGIEIINGFQTSGSVVKSINYPIFNNIDFATVKGIEVSLSKRLTSFFSGFVNYTYSEALVSSSVVLEKAQDVTRTFPANWSQPHSLSFGAVFSFSDHWGFSFLGNAASGLPYTYSTLRPNAERAPWIGSFDFMTFKEFEYGHVKAKIFGQIFNLFNRKNIWWVYPDSGRPGKDANDATSDDYTNNPSMWGPGRRIQAGISFSY